MDGRFRYIPNAPDWRALFGWLQVERRIPLTAVADIPPWAADYPHCQRRQPLNPDSLYIAREKLDLSGLDLPGGSVFPRFHAGLRLTDPGQPAAQPLAAARLVSPGETAVGAQLSRPF